MKMNLTEIGFYTLSDERAAQATHESPLWRCEILVTKDCNFNCPYCRSIGPENALTWEEAKEVLDYWIDEGLKNVRFSGGEPTMWPHLKQAVEYCRDNGVERIAVSTNGSADPYQYAVLLVAGVNDFSISLDACCAEDNKRMTGRNAVFDRVVRNIKALAARTYVTVGVVLTEDNMEQLSDIIDYAKSLGVADVRVIPAAQHGAMLEIENTVDMPILDYRYGNSQNGETVRGLRDTDNNRCPLILDDMAVIGNKHYPCIIYAREGGDEIGTIGESTREDRRKWSESHDVLTDAICSANCLDVCRDYNNKHKQLNGGCNG